MGLILIYYGMAMKRMGGNVRSECEEGRALIMKMVTVTLIGKGR
jgi:hypothetical protein